MLLPFFGNKSHHYLYTLLIHKSVVAAAAWHVEKGSIVVDQLSPLIAWNEDDSNSLFEAADTAIGTLSGISATQVLLSLPDDWVQGQGIHPKKKPILKTLTEKLELSSVGFVVTVEAVIAFLKESSQTPVNCVCLAVDSDAMIMSIIRQGVPSSLLRVGRSGKAQDDFLEACSRLKVEGIPPSMCIFPLSESDEGVSSIKQELESANWDVSLFVQPPSVKTETYAYVLTAVTQSGGREVVKVLPELASKMKEATPAAVPFDFAPVAQTEIPSEPVSNQEPVEDVELHTTDDEKPGIPKKIPLVIGAILIIGLLGFFILKLVSARMVHANVTLIRKQQTIDTTATVVFDASSKASPSANLVQANLTPIAVNGEKQVPTTGKKETGEKAKGTVSLFNKTLQSKKFAAGTQLKKGKIIFLTDEEVTVASASAGQNYELIPGKASVKVTAQTFGEASNTDKNVELTIGTFDTSAYISRTETSLTGGTSRTTPSVTAKDQETAANALLPTLKEQAKSKFEETLSDSQDGLLLDDLVVASKKFNKNVGDEAESVQVTMSATASALLYTKADVLNALRPQLETTLPEGATLSTEALNLNPGEQKKVSSTRIEQSFSISGKAIPPVDANQYASILAGKNLEEVRDFLDHQQTISSYTVSFSPSFLTLFVKNLPADSSKITVKVEQ